ncbi:18120_t:CDS:2 [Gigaspora margarita]|uniref:18120_t:CDS:1 n=1 Tax=Gigaspora margarita TaxID=4874 RepID=A0ABN7ULB1_GIGMA|nr:18120_t:CDS:2 [Gigaspora margarita]
MLYIFLFKILSSALKTSCYNLYGYNIQHSLDSKNSDKKVLAEVLARVSGNVLANIFANVFQRFLQSFWQKYTKLSVKKLKTIHEDAKVLATQKAT